MPAYQRLAAMQTVTCAAAGGVDLDARREDVDAAARVAPLVQRVLHLRKQRTSTRSVKSTIRCVSRSQGEVRTTGLRTRSGLKRQKPGDADHDEQASEPAEP